MGSRTLHKSLLGKHSLFPDDCVKASPTLDLWSNTRWSLFNWQNLRVYLSTLTFPTVHSAKLLSGKQPSLFYIGMHRGHSALIKPYRVRKRSSAGDYYQGSSFYSCLVNSPFPRNVALQQFAGAACRQQLLEEL